MGADGCGSSAVITKSVSPPRPLYFSPASPFDRPAIPQLAIYTATMTAQLTQRIPSQIEYAIFDMDGLLST